MNECNLNRRNKQDRKIDRKKVKYKNILLKEERINCSEASTKQLISTSIKLVAPVLNVNTFCCVECGSRYYQASMNNWLNMERFNLEYCFLGHIVVCNVGLVNGVSEYNLVELFSGYGPLDAVIMPPGKSYSFVTFVNVTDAVTAFNSVNGVNYVKLNRILYLMYSTSVPDIKTNQTDKLPEGLCLIDNFVDITEEDLLLKCITWPNPSSGICVSGKSNLKHRRVRHYGYEFNYDNNNVDKSSPLSEKIPVECEMLFTRLKGRGVLDEEGIPWYPDQLTVNEYKPGQGIPSHIDTHSAFESPIVVLSLGSDVNMDFKHRNGQHKSLLLPRRSLMIMDGESRYDWSHGITPRKIDIIHSSTGLLAVERGTRTSFTFRKIRHSPCHCNYPLECDSQKSTRNENNCFLNQDPSRLENLHVHKVYDEISSHFSETRFKPWPNVAQFVNSLPIGSFLVDVGCGNGKYFGSNKNIFEVGCDRSSNLCQECSRRGNEVFSCNCLQLPLKDGCADNAISIAVIHHLSSYDRRLDAIKEIMRVLRVGGQALIYVWAREQLQDKDMSSYLKQYKRNKKDVKDNSGTVVTDSSISAASDNEFSLPIHQNRTEFKHDDLLVPWKLKTNKDVHFRYYHVFKEGELESMVSSITNLRIVKSYYDQGNWCIQFEKIK